MALTADETELARRQGWQLLQVWDLSKSRLLLEIHPLVPSRRSPLSMYNELWERARTNDALALKALQMINKFGAKK